MALDDLLEPGLLFFCAPFLGFSRTIPFSLLLTTILIQTLINIHHILSLHTLFRTMPGALMKLFFYLLPPGVWAVLLPVGSFLSLKDINAGKCLVFNCGLGIEQL